MTTIEATNRATRAELKQFDEIMELFRKHMYSLRRLILYGSKSQSVDILQIYFQVGPSQPYCGQHHQ